MGMIVGDRINKMTVERGIFKQGPIQIKNDIKILEIKTTDLYTGKDSREGASIEFQFITIYGENDGKILVEGSIFYDDEPDKVKEIIDKWSKKEKLDDPFILAIVNRALTLGNMNAMILANQTNLPSPLRIPKVQSKEAADKLNE